jgi:hypothetical protein
MYHTLHVLHQHAKDTIGEAPASPKVEMEVRDITPEASLCRDGPSGVRWRSCESRLTTGEYPPGQRAWQGTRGQAGHQGDLLRQAGKGGGLGHHLQGGRLHRLRSGWGAQAGEAGGRTLTHGGALAPLFTEVPRRVFSEARNRASA